MRRTRSVSFVLAGHRSLCIMNLLLSLALLVAASIHFILLGEHAAESPALAAGFLAAGVGQFVLASLVAARPSGSTYRAVIVLNVFLGLLYVAHVAIGIPLPSGQGLELELSPREDVDIYGATTLITELAAVVLAYAGLFAPSRPQPAAE